MKKIKKSKVPLAGKAQITDVPKYFPIVGIGASAGGLAAFEAFFSGMPTESDPNMAFVLVQHLDPNHKSLLSEIIRRYTRMQVFDVEDNMEIQPNCIYIIPPDREMGVLNGKLQLIEPTAQRWQRLPVNFFFRSLAQDQHERAIGIILSGNGSDGTQGLLDIKQEGGMVLVQSVETAEFNGMPTNAINTGLVDFQLAPNTMAAKLIEYTSHALSRDYSTNPIVKDENIWNKIFILLRNRTGHDFSMYKINTLQRRVERRMAVNKIETIQEYVQYLQHANSEVDALFSDLLIGVTSFFRDSDAFASLEENIIPKLFANKTSGDTIRIWVAGCSTGEEAYSIAILLLEYIEHLKLSFIVQIFATDIDTQAIVTARAGNYPATIAVNIQPQRLKRFFIKNSDKKTYSISKNIRDMVIFSEHNIIKDPPFSKLDLVSCRNLLIYMNVELQKKVLSLFHYALNNNGFLFLGSSETLGDLSHNFDTLDIKSKFYQCKKSDSNTQRAPMYKFMPIIQTHPLQPYTKSDSSVKLPLKELTEQAILEQIAPASALVNEQGDILYLHGRTGMFFELPSGETTINNIFTMAREGLQHELKTALNKAKSQKQIARTHGVRVKTNGHYTLVNITVRAVTIGVAFKPQLPLYLVILEEDSSLIEEQIQKNSSHAKTSKDNGESDENRHITELENELKLQKEFLQDANEKLAMSNEELKSYNEEMQSMNEELQSTNEELETSKEELQSVNEELSTVNSELQTKVADLSRSNNDINNLLSGMNIGTIFVDHNLCILRFTPAAITVINLISSDMGRPISHIVSNLINYNTLVADTQAVLDTLVIKELEVQAKNGKWYLMRIQPYRTLENVIEGAVISFVAINAIVTMREELRKANEQLTRMAVVVRDSNDAITVEDTKGDIIAWNSGAVRIYGWSEEEALSMKAIERVPKGIRENYQLKIKQLSNTQSLKPYNTQRLAKDGSLIDISITATALINQNGEFYAIATTERPLAQGTEQTDKSKNRGAVNHD